MTWFEFRTNIEEEQVDELTTYIAKKYGVCMTRKEKL